METKYCLDCETKILGRADKKFCSDACRNNYNNRQNSDNRRILQESITNEEGKASVPTKKLTSQGFSFDYFTHILNTKTGNTYYFCYEYGYRKLDGDYYLVVKREE